MRTHVKVLGKLVSQICIALNCMVLNNIKLINWLTSVAVVLPFLERTTFFLYPIGVVIVLSPICKYLMCIPFVLHNLLILHPKSKPNFLFSVILSGFNPSRYFMNIYFSRQIWSLQLKLLTSLCPVEVMK